MNYSRSLEMQRKRIKKERRQDIILCSIVVIGLIATIILSMKLGKEEITADLDGEAKDSIANLDEFGIIRLGAEVKEGLAVYGHVAQNEREKAQNLVENWLQKSGF